MNLFDELADLVSQQKAALEAQQDALRRAAEAESQALAITKRLNELNALIKDYLEVNEKDESKAIARKVSFEKRGNKTFIRWNDRSSDIFLTGRLKSFFVELINSDGCMPIPSEYGEELTDETSARDRANYLNTRKFHRVLPFRVAVSREKGVFLRS